MSLMYEANCSTPNTKATQTYVTPEASFFYKRYIYASFSPYLGENAEWYKLQTLTFLSRLIYS